MEELLNKARAYARSKGYTQEADDFAQEAVIKLSQGRKTKFANLLTDYLRETYGRTNSPRQKERKYWAELDALRADDTEPKGIKSASWSLILKDLEPQERTILVLLYEWDFHLKEIGHCLGVSEGRVCQLLTELKAKLLKRKKVSVVVDRGSSAES